jgi:hypothetical protein
MGGIQFEYVAHNGEDIWCTLGPMVSKGNDVDSERGYLTNSHCSSDPYDTDGDPHWQNLNDFPSYRIGFETLDPERDAPGGKVIINYDDGSTREVHCAEDGCRWSDAAYTVFNPNSSLRVHGHALVAEPKYMNTTSGALEVDPNSMGFQVSGELSNPVEGEVVHKVGRVTGWTSDTVMSTCKDSVQEDDITGEKTTLLCQDFAKYSHEIGDSGSPVFVFTMGGNIKIIGMHAGDAKSTGYGLFSAVANIEEDLGMDLHFGPWFY